MASTIAFPSTEYRRQLSRSDASLIPRHTAAIEVCNLVYNQADPVSWDTLSRFYEADAVYENPVITATSRDAIGDVHSLSQQLAELDAPKPTSMLRSLCGWTHSPAERESWFQISRMWTEVDDVCENESFGESPDLERPIISPIFGVAHIINASCQMGIGDALWSTHSIYFSFPGYTLWAT
jgi:hypothetical protein